MTATEISAALAAAAPATLSEARRLLDLVRGSITPKSNRPALACDLQAVLGQRSLDEIWDEHKRTGKKVLDLLVEPHKPSAAPSARTTPTTATRPTPSARPTPAKPSPTPARPAPSASTPAAPTAAAIAREIVNEQERRRVASLTKTRAQLGKMKPAEIGAFFKNGGKLID